MKLPWKKSKGAETDGSHMSLIEHLVELRSRVTKCAAAVVVTGSVTYIVYERIFRFVTHPYCDAIRKSRQHASGCTLYGFSPLDGFALRMKVSGYGGLVLALPVILWQLWRFIMPGLYKNERRYTLVFVVSSTVLFIAGAVLAYETLPAMIAWLLDAGGPITTLSKAADYFWLSALMMGAFGLGFEFPLLLIALQLVGVLHNSALRKNRRYSLCAILLVVAVLTPGGDPISTIALAVPMYLFYEFSILFGRIFERRKMKQASVTAGV